MGLPNRRGKTLSLDLKEWGTFEGIGEGYAFKRDGKFYSVLETKVGSYRGNHIHPSTQYTLLLSGKADYVLIEDGVEKTISLKVGEVTSVEAGIPHIMVVHEDITTFEWWDGDFIAELAGDEFKKYTTGTIGPECFLKE